MGMRIWYQSMTQLATLTNYRKALEEHAKNIALTARKLFSTASLKTTITAGCPPKSCNTAMQN